MKKQIISTFLSATLLATPADFTSDNVAYKDKKITLKGNVFVNHKLGTLKAGFAEIEKGENDSSSFVDMILENNVDLLLQNETKIHCEFAHIDFNALFANIEGEHEKVTFTDPIHHISLVANAISCSFQSNESFAIENLEAKDGVTVTFKENIILKGDEARMCRESIHSLPLIQVYPKSRYSTCSLTYQNDSLEASSIFLDPETETLFLHDPSGSFSCPLLTKSGETLVSFAADRLTLDPKSNLLRLENNIHFFEDSFGRVEATGSLEITKKEGGLFTLLSEGFTHFQNGENLALFCNGTVAFDGETNLVATASEEPLCFQNDQIAILAKEMILSYKDQKPSQLFFTNEVTLENEDLFIHADKIVYSLEESTLDLLANEGNKVTLISSDKKIEMSVEGLKVTRDEKTNKPVIQGIGKAHFVFKTEEKNPLPMLDKCIKNLF